MRLKLRAAGAEKYVGVPGHHDRRRRFGVGWWVAGAALCAWLAAAVPVRGSAPVPTVAPAPGGKPKRGGAAAVAAQRPGGHGPEMAVVYDDAYRAPAKDLLLGLEAERKAEANARFMHGLLLEETGGEEKAQGEFLRSLALDPSNARLSVKVAWQHLARGDTPGAINLLKDTLKAAPKSAQPALALAYIYFNNLNKPAEAQKYAQQAVDTDPTNIYGYSYLREILKAQGQESKVPALLDRASKAESKDALYWLQLGALYAEVYLAEEAGKDGESLKKTTAIFQRALAANNSNDVEIVEKIADFFVATQQLAEAAPLYQRVVDIDPSRNAARENLARCYLGLKQPEKAAVTLEDSIKQNPVQPHAYETLAKIYEESGQEEKAIANYEQSLLLNPKDMRGYQTLAVLLLEREKPERAVKVLTDARNRFKDQPFFAYLLGMALEQSKQHQQALLTFEQAEIEAQTTQPTLLTSQFYFQYGGVAEQAGLYDKATAMLQKSLSMEDDPRMVANTSNYLGYMWVDHDQHVDEGGDLIKKALEIDPENGAYLDSLGWYYYKKSRFAEAVDSLQKAAAQIKKADPVIFEHLGDTYIKLNDAVKAIESWQKALELDPANPNGPALTKKIADAKAAGQAAAPAGSGAPPKS